MDVCAQPVLRPSGRARSTAVLFHGGRGELLASFSRLCAKAVSGSINCAAGLCSVRWGGAVLRISPSLIPSASLLRWRVGWGIVHWELFEPWIFVRSPHQYFNTLWYGSARIGKQSVPPPYTCSLDEFPSLQLWYGCPMRIQFIFVAISEFLCVKIRLPNTSPPAVSNLPQYDSLTRFRAAIDLWSTPSRLTRCRTGSPINCAPINHGSPMFVCSTLWYG